MPLGGRRVLNADVRIDPNKQADKRLGDIQKKGISASSAIAGGFIKAQLVLNALNKIWGKTIGFMEDSIRLSNIQIKAEAQLAAAMKARGTYTDSALSSLKEYATALQRQVAIGDEVLLQTGAQIEALTGLSDVALQKAIRATVQLAETQDMELKPAGLLIAKTLVSQTNALTRYGITIDMHADKEGRLQQILDQTAAGWDMAKAAANTYEGAVINLNNVWGDLKETLGGFITQSPDMQVALRGIADAVVSLDGSLKSASGSAVSMGNVVATAILKVADSALIAIEAIQNPQRQAQKWAAKGAGFAGDPFGLWKRMTGQPSMLEQWFMPKEQPMSAARQAIANALDKLGFPGTTGPNKTWGGTGGAGAGGGKSPMAQAVSAGFMDAWSKLGFRFGPGPAFAPISVSYGHIGAGAGISALQGLGPPAYGTITGGGAGRWAGGPPVSYVNFGNAPAQARGPWWQSQTANYAAAGIGGFMSGGIGGAIGSLAGAAFGPLGSLAGGLLGGLFGKKKQREPVSVAQPVPVKVINIQDFGTVMLNATKQARAGVSSFGIDRLSDLRLATRAAGGGR